MSNNNMGKTRRRALAVLIGFMALGFTVLVARLFLIQVVNGEEYQTKALQQQTRTTPLGAERGTIYDRNNNVLAKSATVWNVCISPADIAPERLDDLADNLSRILEVDRQKVLDLAAQRQYYYKSVKNRVESSVRDEILTYITENKVKGVFFEQDTKRYYTYGSLASSLLGFTNYDGQGAYGLEAYYEKVLSGTSGMVVSAKNAWGADMHFKYQQKYDAKDGNSIVLTIDQGVQHFVERNLETAIIEHNIGNRAAAIVMDVTTGEIIAMATKNDFNPNDPYTLGDPKAQAILDQYTPGAEDYVKMQQQLWFDQWRNKAISDSYEPGSVFKIITASLVVENNLVSLNEHFYCSGQIDVSGTTYHCWQRAGHGDLDFIGGMQSSCNPVFITLGQRVGADRFYKGLQNFGFGEATGIDIPGETKGILHSYELLSKEGMVELSSTSFGQTFQVTPLQLITAASAAVNGGKLMQPYVVKQIIDPDGNVLETTQPVVKRQVLSESASATMRMLVEKVVDGGSGRFAAVPGYSIGGKTGTSQKLAGGDEKHILSFIGFAPMENPKYAVLVMLDEPELDDAYGSTIAAPVVGAIMQEMLPYLGYEPQFTQEELEKKEQDVPDLVGLKPHDAQAMLTTKGLQTRFVGNGAKVIRQIPQAWQKINKGGTVILYTEEEEIKSGIYLPELVGMNAQEANKTLVDLGLNVELRGVTTDGVATVVGEQWPLAGSEVSTGDIIIITLRKKEDENTEQTLMPTLLQEEEKEKNKANEEDYADIGGQDLTVHGIPWEETPSAATEADN